MKKNNKVVVFGVLAVVASLLIACGGPPMKEEVEVNPKNYLNVNQFVRVLREELAEEGRISTDFLPNQIDPEQTVEYLYWYACSAFGDPNYAISVTIRFPTEESLLNERNRINNLDGLTEISYKDNIIICEKELSEKLIGFFEPPVLDGSMYSMEYAIVSMKNRTITYSELCIWENQRIQETISAQLDLVYESTKNADYLFNTSGLKCVSLLSHQGVNNCETQIPMQTVPA